MNTRTYLAKRDCYSVCWRLGALHFVLIPLQVSYFLSYLVCIFYINFFSKFLPFIEADWWWSYGGQCKTLQKLVVCIVAQCNSSSGCERNWSTFALVHTKLRNKLGYDKLKKLVYVHYNLKLQLQQLDDTFQRLRQKGDRSM